MRRRWSLLVGATLVLAVALSVSACGGDSSNEEEAAPTATVAAGGESVTVGGRVILRTEDGLQAPLDGITVVMTPQDGGEDVTVVTDDAGHFSVEMAPGTYEATLEGIGADQDFESVEVTVPEGETSFQVPPLTVSG